VQLSEGFKLTEQSRNELGNGRVDIWLAPANRRDAMSDLGSIASISAYPTNVRSALQSPTWSGHPGMAQTGHNRTQALQQRCHVFSGTKEVWRDVSGIEAVCASLSFLLPLSESASLIIT
jgi:hypothetical protein